MNHHLFVYGTLMLPEVSERVFGLTSNEEATLHNYRRYKIWYCGKDLFYPAIIEEHNVSTEGILFRNLSSVEMQLIDEYEGDEYERRLVQVQQNLETIDAWCYVWKPKLGFVLNEDWKMEEFEAKHLKDFLEGRL